MPRSAIATASWERFGALITVPQLADAVPLVDAIAPEHLELAIDDPQVLVARVRHAGAIFLGRHTPEAVGDYGAGPTHELPTAGAARFASGPNPRSAERRGGTEVGGSVRSWGRPYY